MSVLVVPPLEKRAWPTLGPQVCDWIEDNLIFGPGPLRGQSARVDDETRGLIYRAYEVYPRSRPNGGRRRFKRVGLSMRKGTAKTEKGAWIAAAELHPEGPVRCDGFRKVDGKWEPVGVGVSDPYVPLVAYTEEQTEELAWGALYVMLTEGPLANDFDVTLDRITRRDGTGRGVPLAGAPNARDGARTTFQFFDETHRLVLERLRQAHTTMLSNTAKIADADAWTLETTTAFVPGENSVAEGTMEYAQAVKRGEIRDSRLFFFHREASEKHDLGSHDGVRSALLEASGPTAEWSDLDAIESLLQDPKVDRPYWERVWLNRPTQASRKAFSRARWDELAAGGEPEYGSFATLGIDGARFRDALAMIGTEVATGHQWTVGIWSRPRDAGEDYEHPVEEIDAAFEDFFERFIVWRAYIDPQWIDHLVELWAARPGREGKIVKWYTHRPRPIASALIAYRGAMTAGDLSHDGDPTFADHVGNACRRDLPLKDDDGEPLWTIEKERRNSPNKIDAAMAGCLSWKARSDALELGAGPEPEYATAAWQ